MQATPISLARRTVTAGTRGSPLALAQTAWVLERLRALHPEASFERVVITTTGDASASAPRGEGVFVKEVQEALRDRRIDIAVHSLKDLPTEPAPGLVLAAVPERADPRDALVGARLTELPTGGRVGTGSPRRAAQMRRLRPDVEIVPLRGNVSTRVERVRSGLVDAAVLALAGLARLGLSPDEVLDPSLLLPAPGQGALAVEARAADDDLVLALAPLGHAATHQAVEAERAVLRALGGGCMLPVAALGTVQEGVLHLEAAVTATDGSGQVRASARGDAARAGDLAAEVARSLTHQGALDLL